MKKCILTAYDSNIADCIGLSEIINNKINYSNKYGWDFICKTDESFDKSRPAAFSKINFIIECLNIYDIVFWNDLDCIFTNFAIDVTQALKENEYIGTVLQQKSYPIKEIGLKPPLWFCTGNILIKSNDYTKTFFNTMPNLKSWNQNKHPWEQTSFNEQAFLLNYKFMRSFTIDEFGTFNKEGWWEVRPWKQGDFILHISGAGKNDKTMWQNRMNLFLNRYKNEILY